MLTLRLNRQGTKDRPFYKIVAVDSRKRRDGRYIEQIGSYNPMQDGVNYTLDVAKAEDWISKGAQPSDTVGDILKNCLLYTSPSPRDLSTSRMPSSA